MTKKAASVASVSATQGVYSRYCTQPGLSNMLSVREVVEQFKSVYWRLFKGGALEEFKSAPLYGQHPRLTFWPREAKSRWFKMDGLTS